ncbi:MAG: MarR family winged helix-turn-helix transcriptional regulator [Candidatus Methanomethylophilaceae archaeon]
MIVNDLNNPSVMKKFVYAYVSDRLKGTNVLPSWGPFIIAIGGMDGASQKDLSEELDVNKSFTTRIVRILIDEGIVVNRGDCREFDLVLTEKGMNLRTELIGYLTDCRDYLSSDFNEKELEAFKICNQKILNKIDEYYRSRGR